MDDDLAAFRFLHRYFDFDAERGRLVRKYAAPNEVCQVRKQYRYFRWRFPDDALLFQVGRFVEFYDIGACPVADILGLKPMRPNRRGVRAGFPIHQTHRHVQALLKSGMDVVLIAECDDAMGGIRRRVPVWRVENIKSA